MIYDFRFLFFNRLIKILNTNRITIDSFIALLPLLHIFEVMDVFTKHKIFEYDTKDKVLMDKLFFDVFFFYREL